MNRKAFYELLKRYLEDDCTEEEKKLVEQWYELLGDDEDQETSLPASEIKATIQRLWPSIQQQTIEQEDAVVERATKRSAIPIWVRWTSIAAVIAGLAFSIYWLMLTDKVTDYAKEREVLAGYNQLFNDKTINDTFYLSDKSMVVLEPQSRLYFPDSFTDKRQVYLEGNAFFKVTKNPKQPFYVYNTNIVTQVLGTSFFVRSNKKTNDIEVAVTTGKVAVYEFGQENSGNKSNEEAKGVILKPNQKVIYNREDHHFRTTLVEVPLPVITNNSSEEIITELNFVFEETPISEVLAHLENAYHIEMVMENETLANCLFSGDIKGQDLYDQLEIICQSVQATYEVRGTRILVKGSGCE
jgi:ferric-dicitrate binding protein FerR (iron transport regulator)